MHSGKGLVDSLKFTQSILLCPRTLVYSGLNPGDNLLIQGSPGPAKRFL